MLAIRVGASLLVLAAIVFVGSADSQGLMREHDRSDAFWYASYVNAQEAEVFDSLPEMVRSVDTAIVGRVASTGPGRAVWWKGAQVSWYANVDLDVLSVLKGSPSSTVQIEVFFSDSDSYEAFLKAPLPTGRGVFFVRNKETAAIAAGWSAREAATERPFNMLVNLSQSYFRELSGKVHVPDPGAEDFVGAWEGRTLDKLIGTVTGDK